MVDHLESIITPPMTKLFQQLVDRAGAHIARAKEQQKLYADKKRRQLRFEPGDKFGYPPGIFPHLGALSFIHAT